MRPHFRLNISGFAPFGESTFSVTVLTRCTLDTPSAVVAKFCRWRAEREESCAGLVSSARMLAGTIDTLTLAEG